MTFTFFERVIMEYNHWGSFGRENIASTYT